MANQDTTKAGRKVVQLFRASDAEGNEDVFGDPDEIAIWAAGRSGVSIDCFAVDVTVH